MWDTGRTNLEEKGVGREMREERVWEEEEGVIKEKGRWGCGQKKREEGEWEKVGEGVRRRMRWGCGKKNEVLSVGRRIREEKVWEKE